MKFELNEKSLQRDLNWLSNTKNSGIGDYGQIIRHLLNRVSELEERLQPSESTELSINPVVASKQKVKCANCSREIETYKDACAPCRIADALLD